MNKSIFLKPSTLLPLFLSSFLVIFIGCEQQVEIKQEQETEERFSINDLIQSKSYWEGSNSEFEESFSLDEEGNIKLKENDSSFSGYIKIRARNGSITLVKSYSDGYPDGDFFEWYENGKLKLKSQYRMGERHGYFYIWTKKGEVYSQRYFQNDLEDFGRFESEGAVESGRSLASLELAEWEGTGVEFYQNFAGDPKRGGTLHIRETEELYTGVITALDDKGKKEAVLRYSNGKYDGRISKWDSNGNLWYEAEFSRGDLVQVTLKDGEPFNPNTIIDLSEDPSKVSLLFED
jgi:antitoxin component YwqK of YwqJK toxin-antitoxin module